MLCIAKIVAPGLRRSSYLAASRVRSGRPIRPAIDRPLRIASAGIGGSSYLSKSQKAQNCNDDHNGPDEPNKPIHGLSPAFKARASSKEGGPIGDPIFGEH